jgi:uncharacterized protein (DUF58 family)
VIEIIKKLNRYEIKIRKAVNSHLNGNFNSIFKGTGLEFSDLRTYQYGDDVRSIDWVTTAKGHGAYVKIFKEEKEQTVFFLLDVSASLEVGNQGQLKSDISKEICGVLTLSAIKEGGQVGLLAFSDSKELYIKPEQGLKQAYNIISKIFKLIPSSKKTDLSEATRLTLNILKKKSVVIVLSDFLGEGYEQNLKILAQKHDLVVLQIYDNREVNLPSLGIIPILDPESGDTRWINTFSGVFKKSLKGLFHQKKENLERFCRKHNANFLAIESGKDFVLPLVKLFRYRK